VNDHDDIGGATQLTDNARFLARIDPFKGLDVEMLEHVAAVMSERHVPAGATVLVESGRPGTQLYVVRDGTFELLHKEVVVDIIARNEVFGHPTLLTGESPEFTTRAREDSTLFCIPAETALGILSRLEGVRFVARTLRDRLIKAAGTMRALPDVRLRPVTSLLRGDPVFCDPDTTIAAAAQLMAKEGLTALLVTARDGLGIITDVDLRDKVVAVRASGDAPVSTIMSRPVRTVRAGVLAQEASLEMMDAGVNHLPVVDTDGAVIGILSANSLMTLDALSPFALRHAILAARTVDEVVAAAAEVPQLFVDLVDAHLDAPALTRVITLLNDAMTSRLIELTIAHHGAPPVAFAWLAFGSTARNELTLASDQDNGLAYADSDEPGVDEYFRVLGRDVNEALQRCGFVADTHGVVAGNRDWRMPASEWQRVFSECLKGWDNERMLRAAIGFDFRHVYGDLSLVPRLTEIVRRAPGYSRFLSGLAELGSEIPSPLGFRQRLTGPVDIKKSGLLPVQNLARFYAFSGGLTPSTTIERLAAVEEAGAKGSEWAPSLREAFLGMAQLQLLHHADAIRAGHAPDNAIDTTTLRPVTKAGLQEALRLVAAVQRRLPQRAAF
jgi:CBS domain-containing protein